MTPRYKVSSVTGYSQGATGTGHAASTAYWVADTANCYREVTKPSAYRSKHERRCAELNREYEAWLRS